MRLFMVLGVFIVMVCSSNAQKYFTRSGEVTFLSHAPMEEISALNERATSVFDLESGAMEWAILINAFKFKKALMEEHFNENYMESTKFPKAVFKGVISNANTLDFSKNGELTAIVTGELEIRGIKKEISPEVIFTIKDGQLSGDCEFKILVADFDIEIPKVVRENIAKEVLVSVKSNYELLK